MAAPTEAAARGRQDATLHRRWGPEVVSAASRTLEHVHTVTAPSGSIFRTGRRATVKHHTYDDHHVEVQNLPQEDVQDVPQEHRQHHGSLSVVLFGISYEARRYISYRRATNRFAIGLKEWKGKPPERVWSPKSSSLGLLLNASGDP